MAYLPTICDACGDVSLRPLGNPAELTPDCSRCGGACRVVPSCSYGSGEVTLFAELSEAVARGLAPIEAHHLRVEVERALGSDKPTEVFQALAVRWPSLVPLVLVTGKNQLAQRRTLSILKTIFEAVASKRSSGTMPVVAAPLQTASSKVAGDGRVNRG